jgi:hypothetical protein
MDAQCLSGQLVCQACKKTFSQSMPPRSILPALVTDNAEESSLVRHLKRCMSERPASLRQKSCRQCSDSKVKCDLQRPSCSKCVLRRDMCKYLVSHDGNIDTENLPAQQSVDPVADVAQGFTTLDSRTDSLTHMLLNTPQPSLGNIDLTPRSASGMPNTDTSHPTAATTPPIDSISDQWVMSLLPSIDTTPTLAKHSMEVLLRVIGTWPHMMAKEFQLPPIIHASQVSRKSRPLPLANCFTLVKMWHGQCHGTSTIVQDTVVKEMKTLFENVRL